MEGKIGGGKPSSSMLPPGFEGEIRKQKHLESMDALTKKQESVEEEKQKAKENQFEKEVDDLLPRRVMTAYGEMSYPAFKNLYKDVFEAVRDKDHFAVGYVTHKTKIHGDTEIEVRSFRRREGDALRKMLPSEGILGSGEGTQDRMRKYITVKVLVSLQQFGDLSFVEKVKLSADNIDEWFENDDIKNRIAWLNDLPDELTGFISMIVEDTMTAYRAALTENLKNRLAPLSPSTD